MLGKTNAVQCESEAAWWPENQEPRPEMAMTLTRQWPWDGEGVGSGDMEVAARPVAGGRAVPSDGRHGEGDLSEPQDAGPGQPRD